MKTLFSSLSASNNIRYIFNEISSSEGAEKASFIPKEVENSENLNEDATNLVISVTNLPPEYRKVVTGEMKDEVIEGVDLGETTAREAMSIVNNTEENIGIDDQVEWKDHFDTNIGEAKVGAELSSGATLISELGKELEHRDNVDGIKNNYVSKEKGISYTNEKGEVVTESLQESIVKAFSQLNTYLEDHQVSDEIFEKACSKKGLDSTDIKNIQSLRVSGRAIEGEDVVVLQNILKKLGLTNGLKEDGTPDNLFGSGTIKDTESLTLALQSILSNEILWSNFRDTLYPIANGSPQRFRWALQNIQERGSYDPENDPIKVFDETIVATGGNLREGGKKQYTIGFLATIPEETLNRVTNSSTSRRAILANREYRKDVVRKWEEFQAQNPQYFQSEMIAKK